jgi:flagellar hook assembly protein FlgD
MPLVQNRLARQPSSLVTWINIGSIMFIVRSELFQGSKHDIFFLTTIFKTGTSFNVVVKAGDHGTISNYNSQGRLVKTFEVGEGSREIHWNGQDINGKRCQSGAYLYKLSTQTMNTTRKMLIVK